eukprot:CAMPEP_0117750638 /NCGR_PEP_ID=MMETSP0947-20121206/10492_1 /TAXON_ID=44440 /ORGANISM="Chattonella subsalsa, Strain CCMP2191" /LENGTH=196 /DNA_ID=CAMNT_0005568853 /DNA_START=356 /DNA_END=944 /DNA_ORIENTATION=+
MAGFGAPTKKKKEAVGTGTKAMKKQIANFVDLKKANAKVTEVFVREKGQDHWNLAGEITAEGDALEVGAYLQKRLIFDHMKETLAFLKQTKKPLEIGVGDSANAVTPVPKMDAEFIKCGFRPSETNSGPFFKATDQFGLKARIDTSSKTGSLMNESDEELKAASSDQKVSHADISFMMSASPQPEMFIDWFSFDEW